jgi:hypothetical protein
MLGRCKVLVEAIEGAKSRVAEITFKGGTIPCAIASGISNGGRWDASACDHPARVCYVVMHVMLADVVIYHCARNSRRAFTSFPMQDNGTMRNEAFATASQWTRYILGGMGCRLSVLHQIVGVLKVSVAFDTIEVLLNVVVLKVFLGPKRMMAVETVEVTVFVMIDEVPPDTIVHVTKVTKIV